MARNNWTLQGQAQLSAQLRTIARAVIGPALEESVLKGAEIVAEEARRLAPVGATGMLAREGLAASVVVKRSHEVSAHIGWTEEGFYGAFQEWGTVHHGPQPHLRPAWDRKQPAVVRSIRNDWAGRIARVGKRFRASAAAIASG